MLNKKINLNNKVKSEVRKVVCSKCNLKTNHRVYASVQLSWSETEFDIQGVVLYEIICCLGCDELSFRLASNNSDDVEMDDEGNYIYIEKEDIYPSRLIGRPPLKESYYLPEKIRNIYNETHIALSTKLKILAGVGIGGLIEAVCLEEKADGSNLKEKIEDLVKKEILTQKNSDILHKTRFLRNRSAHEIEASTDTELAVAFDILENLLESLYLIPRKAEGLKK